MARVLVVDDDRFMRSSLVDTLGEIGHEGVSFAAGAPALEAMVDDSFEVALVDLKMPGMTGLEFIRQARDKDNWLPMIMITAHGTVETAVQAMKCGAVDYILKPFGADELALLVQRALEHRRLIGENEAYRGELRQRDGERPFIGKSDGMRRVKERIAAIADANTTVLIRGETGTGKELVARALHYGSRRAERPFLCVNCAALSAGLLESELFGHEKGAFTGADRQRQGRFELAQGGTLFLDEVSEIDPNLQAKLLRVLQEKEFERVGSGKTHKADVRVLASTNRDLEKEVREGRFRQDLYFRLNIVPIVIPPLRERQVDIELLVDHFLELIHRRAGRELRPLCTRSRQQLLSYHWPGNVRELENVIERAVLLSSGDEVVVEGVSEGGQARSTCEPGAFVGLSLEEIERMMIEETLRQNGGHQKRTAESLGIGVRTLRDKIKKWGLKVERGEPVAL